jgi:hypothetical protein
MIKSISLFYKDILEIESCLYYIVFRSIGQAKLVCEILVLGLNKFQLLLQLPRK